ncbi:hypothetical protein KLP28_16655 [Nocardioidaceae bacterium]|nr:hypothetical protein KLP28_16655 [Nocardioidaceae bacterium]
MGQVARRTRRTLAIAVPVALVAGAGALTLAEREALACQDPLFDRPVPMAKALASSQVDDRALARANRTSVSSLDSRARADVGALWADRCGLAFYVDEATPAYAQEDRTEVVGAADVGAPMALAPLDSTFTLQSRPGASRTIYLDFGGDRVTETAWNESYGSSIAVSAYSLDDRADDAFSDAELREIQRAWQVVSEDYAPFDVNVTTREPASDALRRDSSTDLAYGVRVQVTGGGPIFDACRCGGVAYVNTFNVAGPRREYYGPAWVFTNGTGTSGKSVGEAISHEVGHNFGLSHDGTSDRGYYGGADPWAPVMGVGYYQPMSQWSAGEYGGANQDQDDLQIIGTGAPLLVDDHGGTPSTATPLSGLSSTVRGLISTRDDVDAFRIEAAGRTRISVTPAAAFANLDIELTVLDADGRRIARVDPPVARSSASDAGGLGATWTGDIAPAGTTLTAQVDGVGHGDPRREGGYSDYGSLGRYALTVTTQAPQTPAPAPEPEPEDAQPPASGTSSDPDDNTVNEPGTEPGPEPGTEPEPGSSPAPDPLGLDVLLPGKVVQNQAYDAAAGRAWGGEAPYLWSATGLPDGLTMTPAGTVRGAPTAPGVYTPAVTVTDAGGTRRTQSSRLLVQAAEPLTLRRTGMLPAAKQRTRYRALLAVDGGVEARTWTVQGRLPRGLRLRTNSAGTLAVVKGRPRRAGVQSFRLRVTDVTGASVVGGFQLAVEKKRRVRRR